MTTTLLASDLLLDIARGLARAEPLWAGRVCHDGTERDAVRLLAHERYEVWVIGWPPGHRTTFHDHGGASAAVVVLDGELVERTHAGERHLRAGDTTVVPDGVVHDVGSLDGPATSLHAYSPPLSTMTFYDDDGVPDRVLRIEEQPPAVDGPTLAKALHPAGGSFR